MGSSLSPGLSCIFMEWFETELINDVIPKDKQPIFWLRYIDDVLCCFEDLSVLDEFLAALNSIRDSISFTVEVSKIRVPGDDHQDLPDNIVECIPFLELNVM